MAKRKIEEVAICQCCHEICCPPIEQCKNGHIACGTCMPNLRPREHCMLRCPTCKTYDLFYRNRKLEEVLSEIDIKIPCNNPGCSASIPYEEYSTHTETCAHRPITCFCGDSFFPKEFLNHVLKCNAYQKCKRVVNTRIKENYVSDLQLVHDISSVACYFAELLVIKVKHGYLFLHFSSGHIDAFVLNTSVHKSFDKMDLCVHGPRGNEISIQTVQPSRDVRRVTQPHTWTPLVDGSRQQQFFTHTDERQCANTHIWMTNKRFILPGHITPVIKPTKENPMLVMSIRFSYLTSTAIVPYVPLRN